MNMNKHLETLCNVVLLRNFTRVIGRRGETNISVNQFSFTTRRSTIKGSLVHQAQPMRGLGKVGLLHSRRSTIDLIYLIRWKRMRKEDTLCILGKLMMLCGGFLKNKRISNNYIELIH